MQSVVPVSDCWAHVKGCVCTRCALGIPDKCSCCVQTVLFSFLCLSSVAKAGEASLPHFLNCVKMCDRDKGCWKELAWMLIS